MPESLPSGVLPRRAPNAGARPAPAARSWIVRRLLGVPLLAKLVGANLLVAVVATAVLATTTRALGDTREVLILAVALAVALFVTTWLVALALRPVRDIERVAERVWRGDFAARVAPSLTADADTARLGRTFNLLLDGLEEDRVRLRALAAQTIRAQDAERSRIARELHDSAAQSIAALGYQLTAAARDATDPDLAARLGEARALAGEVLEEIRTLSHVVHPRVLEDLGLVPALEWLARTVTERQRVTVSVEVAAGFPRDVPSEAASALYRVAQEALRNVERHAGATTARVVARVEGDWLRLAVTDDGHGFSLADAEARRPGMGIFAMRERVALVDGRLDIDTAPGRGTTVSARVPLTR